MSTFIADRVNSDRGWGRGAPDFLLSANLTEDRMNLPREAIGHFASRRVLYLYGSAHEFIVSICI